MRLRVLFFFSFLLISAGLVEKSPAIRFRRLTINDGLSLSSVYCIFQDTKGFMWFGTEDGLNRYDGRNLKIFRPDTRNKNSLSYQWIEHIYEDSTGILWFGSRGGLTRFDPKYQRFLQYRHIEHDPKSLSNDTITTLVQDPQNEYLWIGTLNGLNRIDLSTAEIVPEEKLKGDRVLLTSRINCILPGQDGNMWIGTDGGLFIYLFKSSEFKKISPEEISLDNRKIVSLLADMGNLWVGTDSGLVHYSVGANQAKNIPFEKNSTQPNPSLTIENLLLDRSHNLWILSTPGLYRLDRDKNKSFSVIESIDVTHSLSINTGKPILEDRDGSLWYGTFGSGLFRIDPLTGEKQRYSHSPADQTSLSENSINCIFEDRSGVIWLGTFGAGISIYYPQSHRFDLIRHDPADPNSVSSNFIWAVLEDRDGNIWIGTNDKGLNRYSPQTGLFTFYDHQPSDPASLPNSSVRELFQDSRGTIWVGTDGGGLSCLDVERGTFTHFQFDPNDPNSLSNNSVRVIMEDRKGSFWIGTRGGLNRFYHKTGTFKRYLHSDNDSTSLSNNFIYSTIYEDRNGYLWIGTYGGGLNKMNPEDESFSSYVNNPDDPFSISDNVVFSVYEDPSGIFWIGTNDGLNRFNPDRNEFTRFGIKEGLPNEVIYGILPDQNSNLWLSTNLGLSCFSLSGFSTKNFNVNDGLQSNEFNGGAYYKGESGTLYFAGVYGMNIINPTNVLPVKNRSQLVISKLEVLGKEVGILPLSKQENNTGGNAVIMDENSDFFAPYDISYSQEVTLQYNHRFFSLEFAALNNSLPENLNYAYRMHGIDDDWIFSGERNYVSYANMDPGTYYLFVKSQNSDGIWNESETGLKILIKPPFWRTWWFISIEILAAFGLFIYISTLLLKVRTNKILRIQNENIRIANQKLAESENKLMNLNATKDKFFSIISHDLKNPFSSLLSITDLLIRNFSTSDEKEKRSGLHKIQDSMQQIYSLLEKLLTWSRSQSVRIQYGPVQFNLSNVIQENYNLHKTIAEKKKIHLTVSIPENLTVYGDREMINTVVRNLIDNAIKFTDAEKRVEITTRDEGSFIAVLVEDQGTGISENDLVKLFRIDVKFKFRGTSGEKGTGLGLILCNEFVEKNGGKMIVRSILGEGSVFGFTIPISPEALKAENN